MNHQMRLLVLVFSSSVFVVEMCKQRLAFCFFVFTYSQLWGALQMLGLWAMTISSSITPLKDLIPPSSPLQLDLYILNLQVYFLCYNCTVSEYYEVVTLGFTSCQFMCLDHLSLLSKTKAQMMNTFFFFIIILAAACKKY